MTDTQHKLVIRHIGRILSGKLEAPLLDGDCVIAINGMISEIGYERDLNTEQATVTVDGRTTRRRFFRTRYNPAWVAEQDVRDRAYYHDADLSAVTVLWTPENAEDPS